MNKILKWFLLVFGFRYKVNYNSLEIHDIKNEKSNCFLKSMTRYKYVGTFTKTHLLNSGMNGCRHCMRSEDKG